jgi:hypothetical protein
MYSLKEIEIILMFLFPKFNKILNFIFKIPYIFQHLNNGIKKLLWFCANIKNLNILKQNY